MIKGIGHIGFAVRDLDEVVQTITKTLNLPLPPILEKKE